MLLPFQIKINLLVIKFAFELDSKTPTVRSDAEAELRRKGNSPRVFLLNKLF